MTDQKQESIFEVIDQGHNVLLHGPGGVGKTYNLKAIASHLVDQGKVVHCTATTGIAAINLNVPEKKIAGSTLHRWSGIGLGQDSVDKLIGKVWCNDQARLRWNMTDVLIIDEVSMLGRELLYKLDKIGQDIRDNKLSFGGIQLILSGDFFQLPPVKDHYAFKSKVWSDMNLRIITLETPQRHINDLNYFDMLLRFRKGVCTTEDEMKLKDRVRAYDRMIIEEEKTGTSESTLRQIKPTILYSKKKDVYTFNMKELDKLDTEENVYIADDVCKPLRSKRVSTKQKKFYERLLDDAIPKDLTFKVGSQVMLKCNLDVKNGLVNGSRAVITEVGIAHVQATFVNGTELRVSRHTWTIEDKNVKATRSQIPFILAWALTIHKSQGATLDYVVCDLGTSVFACGQAYVALSRVRSLSGLFLSSFYSKCIKADSKVIEYIDSLH